MTHDKPRPSVQLTVATACQLASFDSQKKRIGDKWQDGRRHEKHSRINETMSVQLWQAGQNATRSLTR
jgi:hypothetical protein